MSSTEDEEAAAHQSQKQWTDRLPSQMPGLCIPCQKIDLSRLFEPIANDVSSSSADELAEVRAVYLDEFSLLHALQYKHCGLCGALSKCGVLAGLSMDNAANLGSVRCCIRPKITWLPEVSEHGGDAGQLKASLSGQLHVWFYKMKQRQKFARPTPLPEASGRKKLSIAKRIKNLRSQSSAASNGPGDPQDADALDRAPSPGREEDGTEVESSTAAAPSSSEKKTTPILPGVGVVQLTLKSAVASWTLDVVNSQDRGFVQARAPLSSHVDTELCRTWLLECVDNHDHPTTIAGISTPLFDPNEKFVALTYTWGKSSSSLAAQFARVTTSASKGFEGLSSFPPTIRDAIVLARELGFAWLWVDRVCIEQSNDAEKASLIPYMKDIFAAAQLTIVASSGSDANRGLPGTGNTKRTAEEPSVILQNDGPLELLPTPISFNAMLQQSSWRTRGWCFEEHVFSRRLLYVFPSEIFFSCAKGTFRESTGRFFSTDIAGSTWGDRGRTPPTIIVDDS